MKGRDHLSILLEVNWPTCVFTTYYRASFHIHWAHGAETWHLIDSLLALPSEIKAYLMKLGDAFFVLLRSSPFAVQMLTHGTTTL